MNAHQLADELNRKLTGKLIGRTAAKLRQQADRIAELEKELFMKSARVKQLEEPETPCEEFRRLSKEQTNAEPVAWMVAEMVFTEKTSAVEMAKVYEDEVIPLYTTPQTKPLKFPTMLRKMWSGGEVQKWIDENQAPQTKPLSDEEIKLIAYKVFEVRDTKEALFDFARAIEAKVGGEK